MLTAFAICAVGGWAYAAYARWHWLKMERLFWESSKRCQAMIDVSREAEDVRRELLAQNADLRQQNETLVLQLEGIAVRVGMAPLRQVH